MALAPNLLSLNGTTYSFVCSDGCASSVLTTGPALSLSGGTGLSTSGNRNVGSWTISLAGAVDNNSYTINYITGTLTVTPAPLTITADNKTMTHGYSVPALTASYSGLIGGEGSSVVSGLSLSTAGTNSSNIGNYSIIASGGTAGNYAITDVNGTLTITGAATASSARGIPSAILDPAAFLIIPDHFPNIHYSSNISDVPVDTIANPNFFSVIGAGNNSEIYSIAPSNTPAISDHVMLQNNTGQVSEFENMSKPDMPSPASPSYTGDAISSDTTITPASNVIVSPVRPYLGIDTVLLSMPNSVSGYFFPPAPDPGPEPEMPEAEMIWCRIVLPAQWMI